MPPDTNPDAVKRLTDDEVANIRFDLVNTKPSSSPMGLFRQHCEGLLNEHDALCATVRALREKYDTLKSKIAWHRDGVGPDVPVLQERYDRLMAQRSALTTELANIYHVITNEECDRAVALGMATSAVSSLLNQNTALREQLAETQRAVDHWSGLYRKVAADNTRLIDQIAEIEGKTNA